MDTVKVRLTVLFEDPFWVGVYERSENLRLQVSRIVFGSEPKDYEVYDYLIKYWHRLKLSPPVAEDFKSERRMSPKRMQRAVSDELSERGIGTKAQNALKMQQEQNKLVRKSFQKKKREDEAQRQFELKQLKKKAKHKGR